jgi:hypothetical protein
MVLNVYEQVDNWVVAPHKKPECDYPDNEAFNKQVSMLRIHSEHAIGLLKGHFQSLRDLRMLIQDERSHKMAVYWIVACISIHSFAIQCKLERQADDHDLADDPFVAAGLPPAHDKREQIPATGQTHGAARLARGKQKREELRTAWMTGREQQVYMEDE